MKGLHVDENIVTKGERKCLLQEILLFATILSTLYSIDTHFDASATDSFLKTLWEKEKLLVMSNFSFSHNVFHSIR